MRPSKRWVNQVIDGVVAASRFAARPVVHRTAGKSQLRPHVTRADRALLREVDGVHRGTVDTEHRSGMPVDAVPGATKRAHRLVEGGQAMGVGGNPMCPAAGREAS